MYWEWLRACAVQRHRFFIAIALALVVHSDKPLLVHLLMSSLSHYCLNLSGFFHCFPPRPPVGFIHALFFNVAEICYSWSQANALCLLSWLNTGRPLFRPSIEDVYPRALLSTACSPSVHVSLQGALLAICLLMRRNTSLDSFCSSLLIPSLSIASVFDVIFVNYGLFILAYINIYRASILQSVCSLSISLPYKKNYKLL